MKLFKKLRKGFTLIELVVVIAVIAILSAVSVVSYVAITNRAHQSNDQQLVDQVNTSLYSYGIQKKPSTMHEALLAVEEDGFIPANMKISPEFKGYKFAYNLDDNQFVILDSKMKVTYPKDANKDAAAHQLWLFADSASDISSTKLYSHYLRPGFAASEIAVEAGVDVGENTGIAKITYTTSGEQEVVIRTIGGALEVGSSSKIAKGTVKHYNYVDSALVYTEKNSFHAYGAVGQMKLKEGRAVAEKGGIIYLTEAPAEAEVKQSGGIVVIPAGVSTESVDRDVAASIGYNAPAAAETYDAVVPSTDKTYNIASLSELEHFRDIVNGGFNFKGLTVKLTSNITLEKGWTPIGEGSRYVNVNGYEGSYLPEQDGKGSSFAGVFDGNHKTITNLNSEGYVPSLFSVEGDNEYLIFVYGLFGILNNATVKDLTLKDVHIDFSSDISIPGAVTKQQIARADSVGAVAGFSAEGCTISGVTVNGFVKASDAVAGVLGRAYGKEGPNKEALGGFVSISNCINNATITATGAKAAGILGFANKGGLSVSLLSNTNNGEVSAKHYASGVSVVQALSSYTISNNKNTGNISVEEFVRNSAGQLTTTVGVTYVSTILAKATADLTSATGNTNSATAYLGGEEKETKLVCQSYSGTGAVELNDRVAA